MRHPLRRAPPVSEIPADARWIYAASYYIHRLRHPRHRLHFDYEGGIKLCRGCSRAWIAKRRW
jgi:hypothetical protein